MPHTPRESVTCKRCLECGASSTEARSLEFCSDTCHDRWRAEVYDLESCDYAQTYDPVEDWESHNLELACPY
jgi:hypothetical protein